MVEGWLRRKQAGECTEAGDNPKRERHQSGGCTESSDKSSDKKDSMSFDKSSYDMLPNDMSFFFSHPFKVFPISEAYDLPF